MLCGDKFACTARAIRDFGVGGNGGWGQRRWRGGSQPPTVISVDTRSGAYHWVENDYSFIHLQNSPYFNLTNRKGGSGSSWWNLVGGKCYNCPRPGGSWGGCYDYNTESPITNGWLRNNMEWAASNGKKVVIFVHRMWCSGAGCPRTDTFLGDDAVFVNLVKANNVVAIFTGHTHDPEWLGPNGARGTIGGNLKNTNTPVFNSGAVWYGMFLRVSLPAVVACFGAL